MKDSHSKIPLWQKDNSLLETAKFDTMKKKLQSVVKKSMITNSILIKGFREGGSQNINMLHFVPYK